MKETLVVYKHNRGHYGSTFLQKVSNSLLCQLLSTTNFKIHSYVAVGNSVCIKFANLHFHVIISISYLQGRLYVMNMDIPYSDLYLRGMEFVEITKRDTKRVNNSYISLGYIENTSKVTCS